MSEDLEPGDPGYAAAVAAWMGRKPLPRSEWRISPCDGEHVCLAMHTTNGDYLSWDRVALSDLPKVFACSDYREVPICAVLSAPPVFRDEVA